MDLSMLPSEIMWIILEHLPTLSEKKNASLVCSSWNKILFNSPKSQENLKLRICARNRSNVEEDQQFEELFDIMIASERNYVNIEFCYIDFNESPIACDFLLFIVTVCSRSVRCLKFESCAGLYRSLMLDVLRASQNLHELHVINHIDFDGETVVEPFALPTLRKICLYISNNCPFYEDICWIAPRLEELRLRTRDVYIWTKKYVATVEKFCKQLKTFECITERASNVEEMQNFDFTGLINLKMDMPGALSSKFISSLQKLENLDLKGDVSDDVIRAVSGIPRLKSLTLKCDTVYRSHTISHLSQLSNLNSLCLSEVFGYSWKHINLPLLSKLHVQSVGDGFPEFLKRTSVTLLEIHDEFLSNKLLQKICCAVPKVQKLDLAMCRYITDAGLKNIPRLSSLRELRLWEVGISSNFMQRWRAIPKLKKLLFYFCSRVDDTVMEEIATKATNLEQVVFYDCYNITEEATDQMKKQLPDCEVLRIFRGSPLPASLVYETQIYYRSVQYPNGVLKLELPFSWD